MEYVRKANATRCVMVVNGFMANRFSNKMLTRDKEYMKLNHRV